VTARPANPGELSACATLGERQNRLQSAQAG
jgi:hypothetical protein